MILASALAALTLSGCGGGGGSTDAAVTVLPSATTTSVVAAEPSVASVGVALQDMADPLVVAALAVAAGDSPSATLDAQLDLTALTTDETAANLEGIKQTEATKSTADSSIQSISTAQATLAATVVSSPSGSAGLLLGTSAVPKENWPGAVSKYNTVVAWRSWIASRKAINDVWTGKTRERPDLIGGYMHDYINPTTGIPLAWTPETPEPANGGAAQQIKLKQAWVFYLRDYNLRRLGDAARIFKVTGETKYRDWAAAQLDFYATNYLLWPLRTNLGKARMFQNGLDEATASFTLLDAARLLQGSVDAARAEKWRTGLFMPMADNLKAIASPLSNISLWHGAAVAAIGMRFNNAALTDWGLNSSYGVRSTLAAGMTADNLWNEGSFSYNSYVIAALHSLITASAMEGKAAQVLPERDAVKRLLLGPLDYRFDDGTLPTPGDATALTAIDPGVHISVYRSTPTYWGLLKANSYQSWDTLVDPPSATPSAPTVPLAITANFPSNRMAVLRSGSWQAFVHYGQVTINHAQQEAPSYELYTGTTRISTDSGTVSYGSPYHSDYFTKAPANNMALVDGQGQTNWAPGTVEQFDAANNRITVSQSAYLPNASVSRSVQAKNTGFTESTTLRTTDSTAHRLGVVFHTGCTVTPLSGLVVTNPSTKPPANAATAYWTGMTPYLASATWKVQLMCGATRFSYTVAGPAGQTVFIGKGPTTPLPATRAVLYYETTARQAQFEATIAGL